MNRVKKVSRRWQRQRPRVLAQRERWQRARRAHRSVERKERDRDRST